MLTQRYAHVASEARRRAVDLVRSIFEEATQAGEELPDAVRGR